MTKQTTNNPCSTHMNTGAQLVNSDPISSKGRIAPHKDNDMKKFNCISMSTGEMIHTLVDFRIVCYLPLVWERVYRSGCCDQNNGLGFGWSHPFSQFIEIYQDYLVYVDTQQRSIRFPIPNQGQSSIHLGESLEVQWIDATGLKITQKDGQTLMFPYPGKGSEWLKERSKVRSGGCIKINIAEIIAANGAKWSAIRNSTKDLIGLESNFGIKLRFQQKDGLIRRITQGHHQWVRYEYDNNRNLVAIYDGAACSQKFTYDDHLIQSVQEKSDARIHYSWDKLSEMAKCLRRWRENGTEDYILSYDEKRRCAYCRDANGLIEKFQYDELGRISTYTNQASLTYTTEYDAYGNLLTKVDPDGAMIRYIYDEQGYLVKKIEKSGTETVWSRHDEELKTQVSCENETWLSKTIEQSGQINLCEDSLGNSVQFDFSKENQLKIHKANQVTEYLLNTAGRIAAVKKDDEETQYKYDDQSNLIAAHLPSGAQVQLRFDQGNRLSTIYYVEKHSVTPLHTYQFAYDSAGRLLDFINANSDVVSFQYDENNQPIVKTNTNNEEVSYRYDEYSNLIAVSDGEGHRYRFSYDSNNRLVKEISVDGRIQSYQYDACGRVIRHVDGCREITFERDQSGRITKEVAKKWQHALGIGKLIGEETSEYSYDSLGRMASAKNSSSELHWQYEKVELDQESVHGSKKYMRRITESSDQFEVVFNLSQQGSIDSIAMLDEEQIEMCQRDEKQHTKYDGKWGKSETDFFSRVKSIDEYTFDYDLCGNVVRQTSSVTGEITTFEYNAKNQLVRVSRNGDTVVKFQYDALGRRNSKITAYDTIYYCWSDDKVICEKSARSSEKKLYISEINEDHTAQIDIDKASNLYYTEQGYLNPDSKAYIQPLPLDQQRFFKPYFPLEKNETAGFPKITFDIDLSIMETTLPKLLKCQAVDVEPNNRLVKFQYNSLLDQELQALLVKCGFSYRGGEISPVYSKIEMFIHQNIRDISLLRSFKPIVMGKMA